MKNIHVLPTDKPSRLHKIGNELGLTDKPNNNFLAKQQNIYITSDEEIKIGDWVYCLREGFEPVLKQKVNPIGVNNDEMMKKIILTTDQDLDGVQAIDDEFLEWFIKNPSCEWVEVNHFGMCCSNQLIAQCINCNQYNPVYKIIIPKEEPKQETLEEEFKFKNRQMGAAGFVGNKIMENVISKFKQETPEEAAAIYSKHHYANREPYLKELYAANLGFIDGAKWQAERMYSEEEVFNLCREFAIFVQRNGPSYKKQQEWFEQFKKK